MSNPKTPVPSRFPGAVAAGLAVALFLPLAARPGAGQPQNIGGSKQLLIDDSIMEKTETVSWVLNMPERFDANPVLRPDREWEGNYLRMSTVIYDESESIWKMWYSASAITAQASPPAARPGDSSYRASGYVEDGNYTCYATSRDGIHWHRPNLGLVEFKGSKNNNIIPVDRHIDCLQTMLKDDHEQNPARRYKGAGSWILWHGQIRAASGKHDNGAGFFFSPDGIHPTPFQGNPVVHSTGDDEITFIGWDDRIQKYIGYFRPERDRTEKSYERLAPPAGNDHMRTIGYAESADFIHWSELEPALVPDDKDPVDLQFYHMPAMKYGTYYLGFPWLFRTNRLTMEAGFAYSHDGKSYTRYKMTFFGVGSHGTWDDSTEYVALPVVRDDKLWFYYGGSNWLHSAVDLAAKGTKAIGAIGLATLPLDGFVSMEAGPNPGFFVTKPLIFTGKRLVVNLEESAKGSAGVDEASALRVGLLDGSGHELEGGLSEIMTHTAAHQKVDWRDREILERLAGQPVCLRFQMRNVKLYSFQFQE